MFLTGVLDPFLGYFIQIEECEHTGQRMEGHECDGLEHFCCEERLRQLGLLSSDELTWNLLDLYECMKQGYKETGSDSFQGFPVAGPEAKSTN